MNDDFLQLTVLQKAENADVRVDFNCSMKRKREGRWLAPSRILMRKCQTLAIEGLEKNDGVISYLKPAKCNPYKYSFSIRIVRHWNSLPGFVVEAGSLSRFKSALKRFLNIP